MYTPPFTITSKIVNLIAQIAEFLAELSLMGDNPAHVALRKKNRIQTIHSSLAIENNSLSIEQITAIIEGKRVLGNPNEIQEVKNAVQAYDLVESLNPFDEKDLLKAHKLMMSELVNLNGKYRNGGVGIFDGKEVVHLAPPAERVPILMADLFDWLKNSDIHPLIKSCVFHYEFEFIHPFEDGNGRMGRLWQTVILKEWKKVFLWLPIETLIKENQEEYYKALKASDTDATSTCFIEFMLETICKTLKKLAKNNKKVTAKVTTNVTVNVTVNVTAKVTVNQQKILQAIKENPYITQDELTQIVGIARKNIVSNMKRLQENGLIKRVGADKNGHWEVCE